MKQKVLNKVFLSIEAGSILIIYGWVINVLTYKPGGVLKLAISLLCILGGLLYGSSKRNKDDAKLWMTCSAMTSGLLLFTILRFFKIVYWPLGKPADLKGYFYLLLSHLALVICVITPLLWLNNKKEIKMFFTKGYWSRMPPVPVGFYILAISIAGVWFWAIWHVITHPLPYQNSLFFFVMIAFCKALLTGGGEELCYRGFIQKAAVKRLGFFPGIIFQAGLYTAFHLRLGPAFFGYGTFLACVFFIGILFGYVSHKTGNIGWAVLIHSGIDMVIEWHNICLT